VPKLRRFWFDDRACAQLKRDPMAAIPLLPYLIACLPVHKAASAPPAQSPVSRPGRMPACPFAYGARFSDRTPLAPRRTDKHLRGGRTAHKSDSAARRKDTACPDRSRGTSSAPRLTLSPSSSLPVLLSLQRPSSGRVRFSLRLLVPSLLSLLPTVSYSPQEFVSCLLG